MIIRKYKFRGISLAIVGVFVMGSFFSSCKNGNEEANSRNPNIIFFLVDDMGWQDTSLPFWSETTPLNQKFHTPNMEKLASQGMMFTQAYANSICSPSRTSLMTGMNAARHKVTNWTLRKDQTVDAKDDLFEFPGWNLNGLQPANVDNISRTVSATNLPEILQKNGYFTIHCGKAHWGAEGTPGANPLNLGFDINIAGHFAGGVGSFEGIHDFSAAWRDGDLIWDVPGINEYHGKDIHLTDVLTMEAKEAMDKALETEKPFYLYMSHYAVHQPWAPHKPFYQKYIDRGFDESAALYASMVEGMDKSLGDLMTFLEEKGISDNTVILFMSDNGGVGGSSFPLNSGKGSAYEGGIREPMIVKWPGVVEESSVCEEYLVIEDYFPSILEIAGIEAYQTKQIVDGKSFVPMLKKEGTTANGRDLFWHFPNKWGGRGPGIGTTSTIRSGDWKLVYWYKDHNFELFNIPTDIGEKNNMAEQYPEKVKDLASKLGNFLREVDATLPINKFSGKPVPYPDEI